jgi:hypothetical protein
MPRRRPNGVMRPETPRRQSINHAPWQTRERRFTLAMVSPVGFRGIYVGYRTAEMVEIPEHYSNCPTGTESPGPTYIGVRRGVRGARQFGRVRVAEASLSEEADPLRLGDRPACGVL